jgi:hypothetical protein
MQAKVNVYPEVEIYPLCIRRALLSASPTVIGTKL